MELKVICKRLITQNLDEGITEGEYGADVIGITVPRMYGEQDLSEFSFRLTAISDSNKSIAEQVLAMDSIDEENIRLLWEVTPEFTVSSGEISLILTGVNTDNTAQIKFVSQPVTINDDSRLEFLESPTILEQAYNQVQLEVQKALDAAERAEAAAGKPIVVPAATKTEIGGILSGGDISVDGNGSAAVMSVNGKTVGTSVPENAVFTDTVYTLPIASSTNLGGVRVDNKSIRIGSNGVIYVPGHTGSSGETLSGASEYTVENSVEYPVLGISVVGKTTQDNGVPSPDSPAEITNVGDSGSLIFTSDNGSDLSIAAKIESGMPLCSMGDIHDELIFNPDGSGRIIKHFGYTVLAANQITGVTVNQGLGNFFYTNIIGAIGDNSDIKPLCNRFLGITFADRAIIDYLNVFRCFMGQDGRLILRNSAADNRFTTVAEMQEFVTANRTVVIYPLAESEEISFTAEEMAALRKLCTFDGTTHIGNDSNTEMDVKICTNPDFAEYIYPLFKSMIGG